MLITPAHAQSLFGGGDGATSTLVQVAPLALIFVVFYFFLIRPQQQKAKEQKAMLSAIRRGDRVVTGGGLIGTVSKAGDDEVTVDLAEGVRVRVVRSTIASVLTRGEPIKSSKEADDKDDDAEPAKSGGKRG
ncbi:MAG: preprotein translocase subunit YajC [Stellaceae bacterium]